MADTKSVESEIVASADRFGVAPMYIDAFGDAQQTSVATLRAVLGAMGVDVSNDTATIADLDARLDRPWTALVEPVTVAYEGATAHVRIAFAEDGAEALCTWRLDLEDGSARSGAFTFASVPLVESRIIANRAYARVALEFDGLPLGYHRLTVSVPGRQRYATLIVVPKRCFLPPAIAQGGSVWGLAVQTYGLRAADDGGIGDLTCLHRVLEAVAAHGGALVGTSPLHDVDVDVVSGSTPSPYSPKSRLAISALYLDVRALPGFREDDVPNELREAAKSGAFIDYGAVAAYKDRAIDAAFARFCADGEHTAMVEFRRFVDAGGAQLLRGAVFAALARQFGTQASGTPWQAWPAPYRDPSSPQVAAFADEYSQDVTRAQYVQWQADVQLGRIASAASAMPIGLYRDVAVGAANGGTETWTYQDTMRGGVRVGAPPDILNRAGQDWGVAPFDPVALREAGYAPFAALVRANMRHAGAVRIDHAMGLARLWWIPAGLAAPEGAYVKYRLDEMLGVLALESVRAKCLVIGEDLGTVPAGFRETLAAWAVLSYRLLTFEVDDSGAHVPAADYPSLALVASSTHDLAPIAAHVTAHDVGVRESIGLLDADAAATARSERAKANDALFAALAASGTSAASLERWRDPRCIDDRDRERIVDAATRFLAQTPSAILMLPLEDVLGDLEAPNLPTTLDEHPNWRRRALVDVAALASHPRLAALATLLRDFGRAG